MKIGIIGINMYPKQLNFACGLHTFAFQQFLLQNNIENEVIDYKPVYFNGFDMAHPADYYRQLYNKKKKSTADTPEKQKEKEERLVELQELVDAWSSLYQERESRYHKFQNFIDKYYVKTPETYDSDLLEIKDPGFDCYMCVTDVIWKVLPTHIYDRGFFLGSKCMEGKQKISYAASRGVSKSYLEDDLDLFFHYINDIDIISVREKSTKDFIEDNSQKKAALVVDPVLLHDKSFWQKYSVKPKEENYILLYYVMEKAKDTVDYAVQYAKENNLQIIELSDLPIKEGKINDPDVKHLALHDVGMEEWLGYIEHANCIFTNSFHGCCFSIIFEKLFYVGKRDGNKVPNLLDLFDLNCQLLSNYKLTQSLTADLPSTIDYSSVQKLMADQRLKSQSFIFDAIKTAETNLNQQVSKDITLHDEYRKNIQFPINYHSGIRNITSHYDLSPEEAKLTKFSSGKSEYSNSRIRYKNDGTSRFEKNHFEASGKSFIGWTLRFKIDNRWFWLLENDEIALEKDIKGGKKKRIFKDKAMIPHIPVNRIQIAVAEAQWGKASLIVRCIRKIVKKLL